MLIREYHPDDFPAVESLWKNTGIYTEELGDTADLILSCNRAGGKFLVLEDPSSGSVAGTSWMTWDGRRIYLHHFAIQASLQGKGYGRRLAVASLEFARELDCPMTLEVHSQNIPAINLYKSLGFEGFEDYHIYLILDPDKSPRE